MRKREAYIQEVERPLKHKLMAAALSLLMLMNMAPEYGFGLSVRAHADETAPEPNMIITSNEIGQWLSNAETPTAELLPGGDREFGAEVAKETFMDLFDHPFVHENNLEDRGIFYIAAKPDGATTRGDIFYYNRDGAPDAAVFLDQGYSVAENEMIVYEPVITETTSEDAGINAILAEEEPAEEPAEDTEEAAGEEAVEEGPAVPETSEGHTGEAGDAQSGETGPSPEGELDEPAAGEGPQEPEAPEEAPEEPPEPDEPEEEAGDSAAVSEEYVEETQVESAYVVRSDVLSDHVEEAPDAGEAAPELKEGEHAPTQTFAIEYKKNSGAGVDVASYRVDGGTIVGLTNVPAGQIVKLPFYGTSADRLEKIISDWRDENKPILKISLGTEDAIMAGGEVYGTVGYMMPTPPLYTDGVAPKAPAFSQYEEVIVEIKFTPGLKVTLGADTAAELSGDEQTGYTLIHRGDGTWTQREFTFNVGTANDGSAVGKTFGIASASIVGKVGGMRDAVYDVDVAAFEQRLDLDAAELPSFVPVGNEDWSISHDLKNTHISKADGKVTLEYTIGAGLSGEKGPIGVRGEYDVLGRLGFADGTFQVTEELPTFTNKIDSTVITPLSSKIELVQTNQSTGVAGGDTVVTGGKGETTLQIGAYCVGPAGKWNLLSAAMPFYTEYRVTVEYPYDAFVVPFENYEEMNGRDYILTANASLSYQPNGQGQVNKGPVAASTEALLVSGGKGGLTIEKYIQEGKGAAAARLAYDHETAQIYTNGAAFKITPKNGVKLPAGLNPGADGSAVVTLNPKTEAEGNRLNLTLSPGEYEILEVSAPHGATTISPDGTDYSKTPITVTVGAGAAEAVFTDMAKGRGGVTFVKTDDRKNVLQGVEFTITGPKNSASPITRATKSASDGKVYFQGLEPGEYTIRETGPLEGYAPWDEDVTVTVKADEIATPSVKANINVNQDLVIKLQIRELGGTIREPQKGELGGRFTALVWPSTGSKEQARRVSLTGKETTVKGLPAYTVENGKATPIQYFIAEDLTKENTYFMVDAGNGGLIESADVPLYEQGKAWKTTVTNGYGGSVRLVKSLSWYKEGSKAPANQQFQFGLYNQAKQPVTFRAGTAGAAQNALVTAGNTTGLTASGLESGAYFWKEIQPEGQEAYDVFYSTDNKATWNRAPADGMVPAGDAALVAPVVYVRNVPKKVRLLIEKQDDKGKALNGAAFKLSQNGAEIPLNGSGSLFWADVAPGTYVVEETKAPQNYVASAPITVTVPAPAPEENKATVYKQIVKNTPNPTLTVEKTVKDGEGKASADGNVRFRLYRGTESGPTMTENAGEIDSKLVKGAWAEAGSTVLSIPKNDAAGNPIHYWLVEESGMSYENIGNVPILVKQTDPIPVGELSDGVLNKVRVENTPNFAQVTIKKTDGKNPVQGAKIKVTSEALTGGVITKEGVTGADGAVTFELPVYQYNGDVKTAIAYTAEESAAPSGYLKTDHTFQFKFTDVQTRQTAGQEYDKDGNAVNGADAPLTFVNKPYITITATKAVKGWGDEMNEAVRSEQGVLLGLYVKGADGAYHLADTAVTDELGRAVFRGNDKGLAAGEDYRVYELYDPNGYEPYPEGKSAVLDAKDGTAPTAADAPAQIPADSGYYYSGVTEEGTAGALGLSAAASLVNKETWVQFKATKVGSDHTPLNLARFSLYREALPAGGGTVTYDPAMKETTPYKTYTSGYTAGETAVREDGVFYTDVLEPGYLYWLVETDVPPEYNPEKTVVFGLTPAGSNVHVADNDPTDGVTVKSFEYRNGLNQLGEIENTLLGTADASGKAYAYTALILDKVLEKDGSQTDCADVTIELWLLDGSERVKLVDTLVTGKDATETKTGIGRAFSQPIDLQKLYNELHAARPNAVIQNPGDSENNTYRATFELVETKMPAGMKPDGRKYTVTIDTADAMNGKDRIDEFNQSHEKQIIQGNEGYVLVDMTYTKGNNNPVKNVTADGSTVIIRKYGFIPKDAAERNEDDAALAQKKTSLNGLTPLSGVTFTLYNVKANGETSQNWNLTTGQNGATQADLPNGYYKIVETGGHGDYDNRKKEIFFTVQSGSQTIEVFNPKTPQVRIVKNGGAVKDGIDFKLGNITFNKSAVSGEWTAKVPAGNYKLTESVKDGATSAAYFDPDKISIQVGVDGTVTVTGDGPVTAQGNLIKVHNPETGTLKINKVDAATGQPITSGAAKFEVKYLPFSASYNAGETVLSKDDTPAAGAGWKNAKTQDVTGTATMEHLDPGWYMVTEKEAPQGYTVNPEPQIVAVDPGKTAEATVKDTAHGKLMLSKTFDRQGIAEDQNEYPAAATFSLEAKTEGVNIPPVTVSIGNDGTGALQTPVSLAEGRYTLTEQPAAGWNIGEATVTAEGGEPVPAANPASFDIEIVSGKTTTVAVKNVTTAASVTVEKVDTAGAPIESVKFTLIGTDYTQEAVTGKDGRVTFVVPNPQGDYTLKETEAPAEFVAPEDGGITLKLEPGKVYTALTNPELRVTNARGVLIRATKYEGTPGNTTGVLAGVPLILEKKADGAWQTLQTLKTKSDGTTVFGNLTEGEYAIREGESNYKDHVLAGVTVGGQTAEEDSGEAGRYLLGSLQSGEIDVSVFNRKPQTLTITKWELGKENATDPAALSRATASYEIYAVNGEGAPGAALPDGARLIRTVEETHVAAVPLQPGTYYVQETGSRSLQLNNEDPRTPTSQFVTIAEGADQAITFVNAPKADSLKPAIEKKAVDPMPLGNPLYEEQPAAFRLEGFANGGNEIGLDSVTVNDDGLQFYAEEDGKSLLSANVPDYRIDTVEVGGAFYDVIGAGGALTTEEDVQATLSVDGVEQTKSVPATFTVNNGKTFSLKYTAASGKLGPHFKAEPVTVKMTVMKQAESSGETKMVRSAVNSAAAVYAVGSANMSSGRAEAVVNFPAGDELPPMDLEKTSSPAGVNVDIGGTITYTLQLSNHSGDKGIQKPVIIDLLPTGVEMKAFDDGSPFKVGEGQPSPDRYVQTDERGRQYVQFRYNDTLEPGKTFTVTYQVEVEPTIMNGTSNPQAFNQAWATSLYRLALHADNPYGLSFRAVNGSLVYEGNNPDLEFVNTMLNGTFGYVSAATKNGIQNATDMKLVKEVTTETEKGKYYKNENAAKAALNDLITYRLTVVNGSKKVSSIRIADLLPASADSRGSVWSPEYVGDVQATIGGRRVYPTVTGSPEGYGEAALKALAAGTDQLSAPDKDTRTLLLDFGSEELDKNATLQVTFNMRANQAAPDQLYRAATNTFWINYTGLLQPQESNPASVVLVPDSVSVGGRIWIDENGNGILDGNEAANKDWKNAVTQVLLVEHGRNDTPYTPEISEEGLFLQGGLTAAKANGGVLYNGNDLMPGGLWGNPPTTYELRVTPAENFSLTDPYGNHEELKRSHPVTDANDKWHSALSKTSNGEKVSHFTDQGNVWKSEEFYLWPQEYGTDQFKNMGLIRTRDLTVKKTESGTDIGLDGAEFALYGPFDDVSGMTAEKLETMTPAETQSTRNGEITFTGLMYYQAYIVKETKAAGNYTPAGALAAGFEQLEGAEAWIVPKGQTGNTSGHGDVTMNVENNRQQAGLTIRKVMAEGSGAAADDVFTFQIMVDGKAYKVGEGQAAGEGVSVTEDGKLQFHVNEEATVTGLPVGGALEIVETLPEGAGYALAPEVIYEAGQTILADDPDSGIRNHVTVINKNNTNGKVTLGGRKVLANQTLRDGQFEFQLVDQASGEVLQTVKNTGGGFNFQPIVYSRADIGKTFSYLIKEVIPAEADRKGVTYDTTEHPVTVTVKNGGETGILTEEVYAEGDKDGIVFRNTYGAVGEITLGALKRTVGADLEADQFGFVLKDTATGQEWTARNGADGSIQFLPAIAYTEEGEYDYTISEVDEHQYGFTYDEKVYQVHVTVTDPEGNGVLKAEAVMEGNPFNPQDAVFINRFSNLSLDLYKYRDGNTNRYLNGAEFALYRYSENAAYNRGVLVGSATTASGGRLRFENLEAGQYVLVETYVPSRYEALESQYVVNLSYDGNNGTAIELVAGGRHASVRDGTLYVPNRYRGGGSSGDDDDDDDGGRRNYDRDNGRRLNDEDQGEQPLTQIPEPAVPLSDAPNPLIEIPDEDVPLGALPNTGGFPVGAFAVIGGLLALLGIKIKKRKHAE